MGFMPAEISVAHLAGVREIMKKQNLDAVLVYYDEFNIGNGWYLTGWCPQMRKSHVFTVFSPNITFTRD